MSSTAGPGPSASSSEGAQPGPTPGAPGPRPYSSGPPPGAWQPTPQQRYEQQRHDQQGYLPSGSMLPPDRAAPAPYAGHPYPPPPGYGPYPGPGEAYPYRAPWLMSETDQRLWATFTHLSVPLFGFLGPLVAHLALRDRGPWLREHTTEALNFAILVSLAGFVSSLLTLLLIGWILLPLVWVGTVVVCILAAVAAHRGEAYAYPLNWRLVA